MNNYCTKEQFPCKFATSLGFCKITGCIMTKQLTIDRTDFRPKQTRKMIDIIDEDFEIGEKLKRLIKKTMKDIFEEWKKENEQS